MTDEELGLIIQLLQNEHRELPVEIRHCSVESYRAELCHRLEVVANIMDKLNVVAVA
jgi:hypothetical protein